jgi:predicted XRE-type DNA-binding protein
MREAEEKEAKVSEERITRGSGNVFSDLGMPDAGERQTKTRLAMAINEIIASRKLRQVDAAKVLNIPQPRVSALLHYRLKVFSVEKLLDLLTRLDQDVEIMIRPRARKGAGAVSVLTVR